MNIDTWVGIVIVIYCCSGIVLNFSKLISFLFEKQKKNTDIINPSIDATTDFEKSSYLNLQRQLKALQDARYSTYVAKTKNKNS